MWGYNSINTDQDHNELDLSEITVQFQSMIDSYNEQGKQMDELRREYTKLKVSINRFLKAYIHNTELIAAAKKEGLIDELHTEN